MYNLDTHETIKRLTKKGMEIKLAEEMVKVLEEAKDHSNLATKDDLKVVILELKTELKTEIAEIKRDMKWGMALLIGLSAMSLSGIGILLKIAFIH